MIYILSIITIAALVFIGVDVAAQLSEWQARIGIGKWSDREAWQAALESRARKWLKRSPTVRISDSRRWVLLDILRGKYRSGTIQAWQDAGLLLGLGSGESERYASLKTDPATGDWKNKPEHVDSALLAYALKKNGALPAAAEHAVVELLYTLKGNQKTIPYRKELPNIRFVDTIGMTAPFLTLCGLDELADAQIGEYDRALLHDSCIPPHAYDICRDVPAGIYDWARGTGWYILGLIESNTVGRFNDCIVAL